MNPGMIAPLIPKAVLTCMEKGKLYFEPACPFKTIIATIIAAANIIAKKTCPSYKPNANNPPIAR